VREPSRTGTCRPNIGIPGPVKTRSCPQISSGLRHPSASRASSFRNAARSASFGALLRAAASRSGVVSRSLTARITGVRRSAGGNIGHESTRVCSMRMTSKPCRTTTRGGARVRPGRRCTCTPGWLRRPHPAGALRCSWFPIACRRSPHTSSAVRWLSAPPPRAHAQAARRPTAGSSRLSAGAPGTRSPRRCAAANTPGRTRTNSPLAHARWRFHLGTTCSTPERVTSPPPRSTSSRSTPFTPPTVPPHPTCRNHSHPRLWTAVRCGNRPTDRSALLSQARSVTAQVPRPRRVVHLSCH
jgi:hypothetical protein